MNGRDKGISLVELLVSLAISSLILSAVIALIAQGLKGYQTQTLTAKLQEDADITLNQISGAIMETDKGVNINNYDASSSKVTHSFQLINNSGSTVNYTYDQDKKTLKISEGAGSGSVLCQNVSNFKVQIIKSSVKTKMQTHGLWIESINNPVQIMVTIEVSDGGISRYVTRTTGIRNSISDMTLQGYGVGGLPDSEVLDKCGFLTE